MAKVKNILIIRDGEHILSEANGRRSRLQVMLAWPTPPAGKTAVKVLQPGTLLAWADAQKTTMTAFDSNYPPLVEADPDNDVAEVPDPRTVVAGVLFARMDIDRPHGIADPTPANSDFRGVAHVVDTEVNGYKISRAFTDAVLSPVDDAGLILALRDIGIRVQF